MFDPIDPAIDGDHDHLVADAEIVRNLGVHSVTEAGPCLARRIDADHRVGQDRQPRAVERQGLVVSTRVGKPGS